MSFALLLARTLGRTLDELAQTMSAAEYRLWIEDYARAPWGEARSDVHAGIVAATIANVNRGRDTKPFSPIDFMPYQRPPEEPLSEEEQIQAFADAMNVRSALSA